MITPLDIRKVEFNRSFRGFDVNEAQTYLESVALEMEKLIKDNTRLSEKLKVSEERLNHFRLIEKTLQDSVLTMQSTLEEKRKSAEKESELIIQDAKNKAGNELIDYKDRIKDLKNDIQSLETHKTNFFIRFKHFLMGQLDWLQAMEKSESTQQSEKHFLDFGNAKSSITPANQEPLTDPESDIA